MWFGKKEIGVQEDDSIAQEDNGDDVQ